MERIRANKQVTSLLEGLPMSESATGVARRRNTAQNRKLTCTIFDSFSSFKMPMKAIGSLLHGTI